MKREESEKERKHKWYLENKAEHNARSNKWRLSNPEKVKQAARKSYFKHNEKRILESRTYYLNNKKKHKEKYKEYRIKNKEKINQYNIKYQKNRRKIDENYNIRERLGRNLRLAFKHYSKTGKIKRSRQYGIDYDKIIKHLGPCPGKREDFHIDHIIPLSSFDFNDSEQILKAFAPENHQWLTAQENMEKGNRIIITGHDIKLTYNS